ncbi:MAG: flexitail domain-containing putative surface protein [Dehalococcoidia bacterium]
MRRWLLFGVAAIGALSGLLAPGGTDMASAAGGATERVSVDSAGNQGNSQSYADAISADGRFVAFRSHATNLVAGDTNGTFDAFVRDRQSGTTERVSVDSAGNQGNSDSYAAAISADGRFVAFWSAATNLVAGDTNGVQDAFVRDRQTGTTERVSLDNAGTQGNDSSYPVSISADGRFVAFESYATNLVASDTNGVPDAFVRDRQSGTTERVSVDSSGTQGNDSSWAGSISADGRFVAFASVATNLVAGDTNGTGDVFVRDRLSGTTERVSVDSVGTQSNGFSYAAAISADGRFVAFWSDATNLVAGDTNGVADAFVRDRQTGTTERVSVDNAGTEGNAFSHPTSISADGRFVAFWSYATNLVASDTNGVADALVRDRQSGTTERVSVDSAGNQGNNDSAPKGISADGRFVAFGSDASNLVAGDTNGTTDAFVRDRGAAPPAFRLPWALSQDGWKLGGFGLNHGAPGVAALDLIPPTSQGGDCVPNIDTAAYITAVGHGWVRPTASAYAVEVEHDNGWRSYYYHVANISVVDNQEVFAGTPLGNPSCLYDPGGRADVPHVHFTMKRPDGTWSPLVGEVSFCGWIIPASNPSVLQRGNIQIPTTNSILRCGGAGNILHDLILVLGQLQSIEVPFSISVDQAGSRAWISWPGSSVDAWLERPDGSLIDPSTGGSGVSYAGGDTFHYFDLANPEPGGWKLHLYGADVAASGESVDVVITECEQAPGDASSDPCISDDDSDGCTDTQELGPDAELGGLRDPINPWDFFDTDGNKQIDLFYDIFGVAYAYGQETGDPGYSTALDRSAAAPGAFVWEMGPPDGTIDLFIDIFGVAFQYGHDCT